MGALQSNYMKQLSQTINQNITNLSANVINNSALNCTALQSTLVQFGVPATATTPGCTWSNFGANLRVNLENRLNQNCRLTQAATTQLQAQTKNIVENAVRQALEQDAKNTQGFLAFSYGIQSNYSQQINNIVNTISTNINYNVANNCSTAGLINQAGGVVYCGVNYADTDINILNDATQFAVGYCLASTVFSAIVSNTTLNDLVLNADQRLASQQGLSSGAVAGIVIAIVVVLAAIALGVYFGVYAKRTPTQQALAAAKEITTTPV